MKLYSETLYQLKMLNHNLVWENYRVNFYRKTKRKFAEWRSLIEVEESVRNYESENQKTINV